MDGDVLGPGRTLPQHAGFPASSVDLLRSAEAGRHHPVDAAICDAGAPASDCADERDSIKDAQADYASRARRQPLPKQLLTLKEFVEQSRLSESTVRRRARDGSLPVVQLGGKGKKLLFPSDALTRMPHTFPPITPDSAATNTPLIPTTGTLTERHSGPRPRWARNLPRRAK